MQPFDLDPQLQQDSITIGDLPLCRLLLANDRHYPWFILVPRLANVREVYQLDARQQQQLWTESSQLSAAIMREFAGDKLNIGALGNVVAQLHIHHIVRYRHDSAWPAPIWGKLPPCAYNSAELDEIYIKINNLNLENLILSPRHES